MVSNCVNKIINKIKEEGFAPEFRVSYKRHFGSLPKVRHTTDTISVYDVLFSVVISRISFRYGISYSHKEQIIPFDEFFYLYVQKNMTFSEVLERKEKETK